MHKQAVIKGDWNDLRYFLAVARTGRVTAAARRLGVNHSTVERRVSALEVAMKAKLFDRLPTGFELTLEGTLLVPYAEEIEARWILAAADVAGADSQMTGVVRISAPDGLGVFFLAPRLSKFSVEHPGLELELVPTPVAMNPSKREADIAINFARPESGHLLAKKLTDYSFHVYVSKEFIARNGEPKTTEELRKYPVYGYIQDQLYGHKLHYLTGIDDQLSVNLSSTNIAAQYMMTTQGLGAGILPDFIGCLDDRLVRILPEHKLIRPYYLIYASNLARLARVRTTLDAVSTWAREAKDIFLPKL